MISVEEALEKVLSYVRELDAEKKPILSCLGQVLAEDVRSDIDVPPLDNSGMDGYAVRSSDTKSASEKSPKVLKVIDTVAAGSISNLEVSEGKAIRIMTGAPIPRGADAVVRFEDTDEEERGTGTTEIGIKQPANPRQFIRGSGGDIKKGSFVAVRGTIIKPAHIGVLASIGRAEVSVIRRPRVALLVTGNELEELGKSLPVGKIYSSNSYSIAAEVLRYGGIPKVLGIAPDNADALTAKIHESYDTDMLITTGGVSAGDYDLVKDVLAREGEITFWTVRMRPGKPIAFGTINGRKKIPHLGLPGNPVSAMITFETFARPAILKMMGIAKSDRPVIEATVEDDVVNEDGRRVFARALVEKRGGRYFARTTGSQDSGVLTSMSQANGLVIVPEDITRVKAGEKAKVIMLDWSGESGLCVPQN